jgi:hypothetical protein
MNPSSNSDPWSRTLNMLLHFSEHPVSKHLDGVTTDECIVRKSTNRRKRQCSDHSIGLSHAHIVERITEMTISVTWHDSTSVNYVEQSWRLGRAHGAGICSLTGAPISCGQSVYKPRRDAKRPTLNQDAMILSEMVLAQMEAVNGYDADGSTGRHILSYQRGSRASYRYATAIDQNNK